MSSPDHYEIVAPGGKTGSWLGIDIGSRRDKVADFCLIESKNGEVVVRFERGRAPAPYPARNDVDSMLDAGHRRLSEDASNGLEALLRASPLVGRWLVAARDGETTAAVGIDSPPGYADRGRRSRLTEDRAWSSFRTPPRSAFLDRLARFAAAGNETPLRQQYYWKLVGIETYRRIAKAAGLEGLLPALTVASGRVRLRETFPSDVFQRADGELGTLADPARRVLGWLLDADWRRGTVPATTWRGLTNRRRDVLRSALRHRSPLVAMSKRDARGRKISAAWADLFDAFTCAYAVCCEDHGCGRLLGHDEDPDRCAREGAILTVKTK